MKTRTALPTRIPGKVKIMYAISDARSMQHCLMQVIDRAVDMANPARREHLLRQPVK